MDNLKNDLISIVIPVYNVKGFLDECLESVLGQTYRDLEIILIDDGSTDGSGDVCDAYARRDGRIRVLHQRNQGVSAARNAALEIASGTFIGFVDPDDAILPEMYQTLHDAAIRSSADIVQCRSYQYAGKVKILSGNDQTGLITDREEAIRLFFAGPITWTLPTKLYRKHLFETLRFDTRLHRCEDAFLLYEILKREDLSFGLIDDVFYFYRQRSDSGSGLGSSEQMFAVLKQIEEDVLPIYPALADQIWSTNVSSYFAVFDQTLRASKAGPAEAALCRKFKRFCSSNLRKGAARILTNSAMSKRNKCKALMIAYFPTATAWLIRIIHRLQGK
ncbi:glycosyltransferase [uncultured Oscillibacter sp.]|uniref:glycosyltransferase family 2 protein n=1 Tax=uncultured Oscillibacter sp. TaxID=876091 RepID=UPI002603D66F|nr:glycosyltransferase [uncultured Oscillibacter sp.]